MQTDTERGREATKVEKHYSEVDNGIDGGYERHSEIWMRETAIGETEAKDIGERRKKEYNAGARENPGDKQWTVVSIQQSDAAG